MMRLLACAVAVTACLAAAARAGEAVQPTAAEMMDDLMYGRGPIGGPFTLTDQDGKPRSDGEFRGKLMIVYFGYTFCPDVCPTDLMAITRALDALGTDAAGVQPIFISIDPARDGEAAEARWRSVVGMALKLGTKLKQFVTAEICLRDFVQGMKYAEPHGDTTPQSTTDWNIATNVAGKVERFAISNGKKLSRCLPNHSIAAARSA